MCAICGCATHDEAAHADGPQLHFGAGAAGLSIPGMSTSRMVQLEADVLGANQRFADDNRRHFAAHGVAAYNLVSSPGSGKTTLLCATIEALRRRAPAVPLAVIEGDQQTSLDAERIRATGAQAVQVNTGRGCHLDARMVGQAFGQLELHGHAHHDHHAHLHADAHRDADHRHGTGHERALLLIENVGNLVCPALWDLGEAAKVVVLSVTEGDDKPLKYPDMFAAASLMLINKIDLLPYVAFDLERCIGYARQVNPDIAVLQLSATRGDGIEAWLDWLLPP